MPVDLKSFQDGDVYIDFPFENVMFRYRKRDQHVWQKFYGDRERPSSFKADIFRDAISNGTQTTAENYYKGKA